MGYYVMVKVIGKDPQAVHKVTCKQCSSVLEYTLSEVTYSSYRDISGCSDEYNYIFCPVCNPESDPDLRWGYTSIGRVEVKGR